VQVAGSRWQAAGGRQQAVLPTQHSRVRLLKFAEWRGTRSGTAHRKAPKPYAQSTRTLHNGYLRFAALPSWRAATHWSCPGCVAQPEAIGTGTCTASGTTQSQSGTLMPPAAWRPTWPSRCSLTCHSSGDIPQLSNTAASAPAASSSEMLRSSARLRWGLRASASARRAVCSSVVLRSLRRAPPVGRYLQQSTCD
jgi:hypothetical protein